MRCNATKLAVELMPNKSVVITLHCESAYAAAILYDDLTEAARKGALAMEFEVEQRNKEKI